MNDYEFKKFLLVQKKYIDTSKWFYGISVNKDPGDEYITDWISKKAKWFREAWNDSCCKNCIKCIECGTEVKNKCENFIKDLDVSYVNDKVCYVDCICQDSNHAIRIYYDDEFKLFNFQFKVEKLPKEKVFEIIAFDNNRKKYIFKMNKFWWNVCQWFKHVWLSVRGKPVYFNVLTDLTYDEAYRMSEFIKDKL